MVRPKFNIPTLRRWFKEIDQDGGGFISRRELIVALRQHKDLQAVLLSSVQEGEQDDEEHPDVMQAKNAEMKRIIAIMHSVDTDGSGTMEWDEFVEFFRRSGFLLEYNTRSSLNDTSFKRDSMLELTTQAQKAERMEQLGIADAQIDAVLQEQASSAAAARREEAAQRRRLLSMEKPPPSTAGKDDAGDPEGKGPCG